MIFEYSIVLYSDFDMQIIMHITIFSMLTITLSTLLPPHSTSKPLLSASAPQDSLLGVIEATMHDGPVYFDCFPDFTVSLSDPHILKVLTLSIRTQGYKILEGVQPLALIYRIYYKCTGTNMNFQAINRSPSGQTMLIQSSQSNASIHVPRTINWSDIELPKE
jgi:hypothetical protein